MSKKELLNETDKQKLERLVTDNITLVSYIEDFVEDLSSEKVNSLHVCAFMSFLKEHLVGSVNVVLTGDRIHLNYDFVEEAKNYGA